MHKVAMVRNWFQKIANKFRFTTDLLQTELELHHSTATAGTSKLAIELGFNDRSTKNQTKFNDHIEIRDF